MAQRGISGRGAGRHMLFGHNTNVKVGDATFHVQTEDRGITNALIDTTIFCRGRVLHRRTNNYFDLLPLDADREEALKLRLNDQHRTVLEEIRSGALHLVPPPLPVADPPKPPAVLKQPALTNQPVLSIELLNAKTWLSGKRALLQVAVRDQANKAVEAAKVMTKVDGASELVTFSSVTGPFGHAQFEFDMPRLSGPEAALVIEAVHGEAKGQLRFQLRAKPRVPSAT
jgi:hypothetical protein